MRKTTIFLAITAMFISSSRPMLGFPQKSVWNKTEAIKQLPFCALTLRILESHRGREVHILMEPQEVTERNLQLLFKVVSEKNPEPIFLETFVSTDVEQLRSLVTNMNTSPATSSQRKPERNQWAYYKRTDQLELFRYNPDFPELGMKTIILRGKE